MTKDLWDTYWRSDLSRIVDSSTEMAAIYRLFCLYDERERAERGYRKERLVEGSKGQPVINPLRKELRSFDAQILQLEDRFGMSPKAKLQLGIKPASGKNGLSDMNRGLEVDEEELGKVPDG